MASSSTVRIQLGDAEIFGTWLSRKVPAGVIVFALSSSTGRFSLRNLQVAHACCKHGFDVLVLDLLTRSEEKQVSSHLNTWLLKERLAAVLQWIHGTASLSGIPIGIFATNATASAVFDLATQPENSIQAIVTRSGRPQFAESAIPNIKCPTLVIVPSGEHPTVRQANERAYQELRCVKKLSVIPSSSRLFIEAEALQELAALVADWFERYLHASQDRIANPQKPKTGRTL